LKLVPSATTSNLTELLQPYGLVSLGVFSPARGEKLLPDNPHNSVEQVVLVGNAGSGMWGKFTKSPEYGDGNADPLDRWSRRIGLLVAAEIGGQAIFPFEGPPYAPFQQWASRAGQAFNSPISLFIHLRHGLWHAYRFALALPGRYLEEMQCKTTVSPCITCAGQPCLGNCPVQAFSGHVYRVEECIDYLRQDSQSSCRLQGCAARHACPEAPDFRYHDDQAQFHMRAFLRSRLLPAE